jgi:hypothetical protein
MPPDQELPNVDCGLRISRKSFASDPDNSQKKKNAGPEKIRNRHLVDSKD